MSCRNRTAKIECLACEQEAEDNYQITAGQISKALRKIISLKRLSKLWKMDRRTLKRKLIKLAKALK
jgi:hypothetical protein